MFDDILGVREEKTVTKVKRISGADEVDPKDMNPKKKSINPLRGAAIGLPPRPMTNNVPPTTAMDNDDDDQEYDEFDEDENECDCDCDGSNCDCDGGCGCFESDQDIWSTN